MELVQQTDGHVDGLAAEAASQRHGGNNGLNRQESVYATSLSRADVPHHTDDRGRNTRKHGLDGLKGVQIERGTTDPTLTGRRPLRYLTGHADDSLVRIPVHKLCQVVLWDLGYKCQESMDALLQSSAPLAADTIPTIYSRLILARWNPILLEQMISAGK